MKIHNASRDARIPRIMCVREFEEKALLDPELREGKFFWLARHAELEPECEWHQWCKSYPAAVLAARGHATVCPERDRNRKRSRAR